MDQYLRELLLAILESDPEKSLDDAQREALMYAMLALHPPEHLPAIAKFADSIISEFKR
jgi:hypothetical protein